MARSRSRSRSKSKSAKKRRRSRSRSKIFCVSASNGAKLYFRRGHKGIIKSPRKKRRCRKPRT